MGRTRRPAFIIAVIQKILRGTPAHLKCIVVTIFLVLGFWVEDDVVQLQDFNPMGLIDTQGSRRQVVRLNHQRQRDCSYCDGQYSQNNVHNDLNHNDQNRQSKVYRIICMLLTNQLWR